MNAEIISVGTELLLGGTVNTDAADLSRALAELGINVYWHSVVGDNPERLTASVELARSRAQLIVTTGGLGPTCDDLTKQTLARAFGLELRRDAKAESDMRAYFANIGREMTENNLAQCLLPEGCTPFYNTCGTAPGCAFESGGVHVIMLPGPPREMNAMLRLSAMPYLMKLSGEHIFSHNIHIFGLGESEVEFRLRSLMNSLTNPTLAPYAKDGEVMLRVTAKSQSIEDAERMCAPVIEKVSAVLGDYIYGIDCASLENRCLELLRQSGATVCTAESCTGGLIAKRLTDIPGSSECFLGGAVVYDSGIKTRVLGVDEALISSCGVVSEPVARALAEKARALFGADYAIGITGLAGPDGDGINPVGTVFAALARPDGSTDVLHLNLGEHTGREMVRIRAAGNALDMLRRALAGLPAASGR